MVFIPNDKLKQKMSKNGSVLQFMYSVAGAGKGLIAMGAMLIGIAIMLAAALSGIIGTAGSVKMAVVIIVPSILLIVLGVHMQKKKESGWLKAYMEPTGLGEQEVYQIEQEFKQPDTLLFSLDKGKDTNSLKKMGFITKTYIKFPGVNTFVFRLDDMVACFYTKKYLCQDGGYDRAFVAYPLNSEWGILQTSPPEKASLEIVKVIAERNPKVITEHHFSYEGKEYDAVRGLDEVIALHKRVFGR